MIIQHLIKQQPDSKIQQENKIELKENFKGITENPVVKKELTENEYKNAFT